MRRLLQIFLLFSCLHAAAQDLLPSNTTIESCNDMDTCLALKGASLLFYDESRDEFYLKLDFSKFRKEADTPDNWVNKIRDTCVYYKGFFKKENFPALSDQGARVYEVNGQLFYGNRWKDQKIQLTVYGVEKGLLNPPGLHSNFRYESYAVNFSLPLVPSDFKLYRELEYNLQTVSINVTMGRINLLKPGMEPLLHEIYYQAEALNAR